MKKYFKEEMNLILFLIVFIAFKCFLTLFSFNNENRAAVLKKINSW